MLSFARGSSVTSLIFPFTLWSSLKVFVPIGEGLPKIMHSLTPFTGSEMPIVAALNKWSPVFSKDANMRIEDRIWATPCLVIPKILLGMSGNQQVFDSLPFEGHDVSQELNVTNIQCQAMTFHGGDNFSNNASPSSFNAQRLLNFQNVVGDSLSSIHTRSSKNT